MSDDKSKAAALSLIRSIISVAGDVASAAREIERESLPQLNLAPSTQPPTHAPSAAVEQPPAAEEVVAEPAAPIPPPAPEPVPELEPAPAPAKADSQADVLRFLLDRKKQTPPR
ncbi:hypothetical protein [Magnetospirillum sp. UT-4]|uniref:hypothetical protein n=1 Tax=Magnetospirillum sp. UT-4 TaxID=2681467 RepID=UPI001573F604|nr:hypothetical protein [Magnetospirillum sp. UT-4]